MERIPRGQGRKKIPMKKIENQSSLEVTFSRRRSGMFKKATELSILCGCQVAVIIFSTIDKLYSFGHTSLDLVLNRFVQRGDNMTHQDRMVQQSPDEGHKDDKLRELEEEIVEYKSIIRAEKTKAMNDPLSDWRWSALEEGGLELEESEKLVADLDGFMILIDSSDQMQNDCGPSGEMETGLTTGDHLPSSSRFYKAPAHLGLS